MLKARIYTEKKDLDDFLHHPASAELNQSIYNAFLSFRPAKPIKASALKIFNEAYYQATRVFSDQHPEDNFIDGYFNNARDDLGSCHDAKLTFSIVFLLLSSTTHRNIKSASFQDAITHNLQNGNPYFDTFRKIAERYEANHIYFDNDFCPTPVDVSQPVKVNWQAITHNFNATCIAEAVTLGDSEDRQHSILDAIELQFDSWKATQPDSLPDINFLPLHSYIVQSFNPNAHSDRLCDAQKLIQAFANEKTNLEIRYQELEKSLNETTAQLQQKEKQLDAIKTLAIQTQSKNEQLQDTIESLKSGDTDTVRDILAIARERQTTDIYTILHHFLPAQSGNILETVKAEEKAAKAAPSAFKSDITLSKSFSKTDCIRVFYTLHALGKFQGKDGSKASLKSLFQVIGQAFNFDFSDFSTVLSASLADGNSAEKHTTIFVQMKQKMLDIFNSR